MNPNALLDSACELLLHVLRFEQPADAVVSQYFRRKRELGPRERAILAETAYEVVRRRLWLEHIAKADLPKAGRLDPPVLRRMALAAWPGDTAFVRRALSPAQLDWLNKAPPPPAGPAPQGPPGGADKLRHNLPDWLANPLRAELGEDFWPLADSLLQSAPLDLRVNAMKAKREQVQASLAEEGIASELTAFSPWGLRVQGKPAINRTQAFEQGHIEVQDEGSQLLAALVDAKRGEMVVDFCAGAGGKTLALGAAMRNTGRLYAFDVSGHRLDALKPRLARSGLANVHPAQIAHERDERIKRLAGKIDRVLVDAPCSGLGTLRRNPDLKWRQSSSAVKELVVKQQAILSSAAKLLKPGGRLVYATCSLLAAENEAVAQAFGEQWQADFEVLAVQPLLATLKVPAAQEPAHTQQSLVSGPHLRLWPHRHGTDGFFAAVWQRLP